MFSIPFNNIFIYYIRYFSLDVLKVPAADMLYEGQGLGTSVVFFVDCLCGVLGYSQPQVRAVGDSIPNWVIQRLKTW